MHRLLPYPAFVISRSSKILIAISTASKALPPFFNIAIAVLAALLNVSDGSFVSKSFESGHLGHDGEFVLLAGCQMVIFVRIAVKASSRVNIDGANITTFAAPSDRHL
jgi:hypothetical protein